MSKLINMDCGFSTYCGTLNPYEVPLTVGELANVVQTGYSPNEIMREVFKKLAAYEDTGKTPEEVAELAKAEHEGRLVVLPCKVGDIVYVINHGCGAKYCGDCFIDGNCKKQGWHMQEDTTTELFWATNRRRLGKTVFLTREEAEKALEEAQKK